jgi:K+-sensing histidine kinase KdpD
MTEQPQQESLSYEMLLQQNQALRQEIESLKEQDPRTWGLFAEASRKLQVYSASIKAAVSSLLNYDIFWDYANQHEFLETIDSSVNQVSEMIGLLTLAFRSQANSLVLSRDSHLLQEILSVSQTNAIKKFPNIRLTVNFPPDGKPVLVDYEYLSKVLLLLYEVFYNRAPAELIQVAASENDRGWNMDFVGLDAQIVNTIEEMHRCQTQPASSDYLSPENILRLHLVCEILHLHGISVEGLEDPEKPAVLRLSVPDIDLQQKG